MNKKLIIIIAAVVVVLGGVGAYALLQKKDSKTASDDSSKTTGSSDTANSKKYSDACKVFTKQTLATVLGGTYGDGEEEYAPSSVSPGSPNYEDLKGSACSFKQDNDGTTAGMTAALDFSITINTYENTASAKEFMDNLHNPQTAEGKDAMGTPTDVSGVGDQAFFPVVNTAEGTYEKTETLYVRLGRQVVLLGVTRLAGVDRDAVRAELTTLAKKL